MDLEPIRSIPMSLVLDCEGIPHRRGKAHCPFHSERTPSFTFKNNLFYCFGCQEGGDTIKFIQKLKGLSFIDSVKTLCSYAGVCEDQVGVGKEAIKRNYEREALMENKKQILQTLSEEEELLTTNHREIFQQSFQYARDYTRMLWIDERLNEIGKAKCLLPK